MSRQVEVYMHVHGVRNILKHLCNSLSLRGKQILDKNRFNRFEK